MLTDAVSPRTSCFLSLFCCLRSPCLAACSDHRTARWPRSQSLHIHLVEVLICVFHACTHKLVCTLRSTWACFGVLSKARPAEQTASLCKRRGAAARGGGERKYGPCMFNYDRTLCLSPPLVLAVQLSSERRCLLAPLRYCRLFEV